MHRIIYISQTERPIPDSELTALLQQAHQANELHQITGVLVYGDNQFMQVLEGAQVAVQALYKRIARDARHQKVFKLCDEPTAHRDFAEWSMAFHAASPAEVLRQAGYQLPHQLLQELPAMPGAEAILMAMMRTLLLAQQPA